jgi:hypothetical protein
MQIVGIKSFSDIKDLTTMNELTKWVYVFVSDLMS